MSRRAGRWRSNSCRDENNERSWKTPWTPSSKPRSRSSSTIPQSIGYSEATMLNDERRPRACSRSAIRTALRSPSVRLDVVREDHGRTGALRPEPAEAQRLLLLRDQGAAHVEPEQGGDAVVEGPAGEVGLTLAADQDPPRSELGAAGDRALQPIEGIEQPRGEAERRRALGPEFGDVAGVRLGEPERDHDAAVPRPIAAGGAAAVGDERRDRLVGVRAIRSAIQSRVEPPVAAAHPGRLAGPHPAVHGGRRWACPAPPPRKDR